MYTGTKRCMTGRTAAVSRQLHCWPVLAAYLCYSSVAAAEKPAVLQLGVIHANKRTMTYHLSSPLLYRLHSGEPDSTTEMVRYGDAVVMWSEWTVAGRNKKLIRRWDSEREHSLRRHCTSSKNTIVSCINSATDRFLQHRFTQFREITQCNGHYAVQGHSRSPISVPIESSYTTSY